MTPTVAATPFVPVTPVITVEMLEEATDYTGHLLRTLTPEQVSSVFGDATLQRFIVIRDEVSRARSNQRQMVNLELLHDFLLCVIARYEQTYVVARLQ